MALKFEPSDTFSTVYKFDRNDESGTPEGSAFIAYNPAAPGIGALAGPILAQLLTTQPGPVYFATNGQRPEIVNNGFCRSQPSAYARAQPHQQAGADR